MANTRNQTTTSVDEHIGQRIQLRRIMLGMSQKDLANICGITSQQIQKYESGNNRIAASRLFDISIAMETPVSFFFSGLPGYIERIPRNGHIPHFRVSDQQPIDPLSKNESLQLLSMYWRLATDDQREIIFKLLKSLLGQE